MINVMKIGILTLPLHTNYGGILQAYALQTVLERMGHKVIVLTKDRVETPNGWSGFLLYAKRFIEKFILRRKISLRPEWHNLQNYKILSKNTQKFIDNHIHGCINNNLSKIKDSCLNLDAIVVGSDQIWRPVYIGNTLRDTVANAYLDFAKDWRIKKISYAASFGVDEWEYTPEETDIVRSLIKKFDAISVREESGVRLCKEFLNVDSTHVLDPTLLLTKEDYEKLIPNSIRNKGYNHVLTNYVLDSNKEITQFIIRVAEERKLTTFKLEVSDSADGKMTQPSVEEWLQSFRAADFVITDSFHACVFCIQFRKPFVVIGNKSRGYGRFESFLKMLGLEGNLISNTSEYDSSKSYEITDEAYKCLNNMRTISMDFINRHISNKQL